MIGTTVTATATEMQNNGIEIIVTKNGREVGRFLPKDATISYLTDSLTGILKADADIDQAKEERLREKYAVTD